MNTSCSVTASRASAQGRRGSSGVFVLRDYNVPAVIVRPFCDRSKVIGGVINLGTERNLTRNGLAAHVVRSMDRVDLPMTYVGDRPGQVFRHTADIANAKRLLGWNPQVSFEEALQRVIDWDKVNRPWREKQLRKREIPIITKTGKRELH